MNRIEHNRIARFIMCSILSTVFMYLSYLVLYQHLSYQVAYFFAYLMSVFFAYIANAWYVFHAPLNWKSFLAYPFVYMIQYILSAISLEYIVRTNKAEETIAPIIITLIVAPITYIFSKYIFKLKI